MDSFYVSEKEKFIADTMFDPLMFERKDDETDNSCEDLFEKSLLRTRFTDDLKEIISLNTYSRKIFLHFIPDFLDSHWHIVNTVSAKLCNTGNGLRVIENEIIVDCRNISISYIRKNTVAVMIWVPTQDILDVEEPATIRFAKLSNVNNPSIFMTHEFDPQVSVTRENLEYPIIADVAWKTFYLEVSKDCMERVLKG